ncbi:MAG: tRNA (N6-threonylcarbamoyladenosine(37)-N6)-methyltransferase TrmO [Clostridia bacterium]|nr:tRNA (N6-threonylcarbamoyladenosine(37)-N6)-methyltransferase TrmO [Clostridia bacterium]
MSELQIVARIRTDFPTKFAIPRQSGILDELESRIEFEKPFQNPDYIRGIEEFSHLWLIWCFSENEGHAASATVRPPRLGGNRRVGVFATRSPFRPNPIGLSSVRLLRVEDSSKGKVLVVTGADLMDGTPIYDIKPYLPFSDSHPEARFSFAREHLEDALSVHIDPRIASVFPVEKYAALLEILRQDPRPSYQEDPDRIYGFFFAGFEIRFTASEGKLTVVSIEKKDP